VVDERDVGLGGLDAPPVTAEPANLPGELQSSHRIIPPSNQLRLLTWKVGIYVITGFLFSFITVMTFRGLLKTPPRGVSLFANLYLAGTIIFGGGPVVIPLLREYIVAEGWVSPRDFLIGLALIQSFPGPNFNFAVYLGSLATAGSSLPSFVGALIGFLGIFTPGVIIVIGVMGLWNVLRSHRWLLSLLRGVNAGAVGLVFTAVYKLWQIGFVDADNQSGSPLGGDPWWVAITAMSFVGGAWFGLSAPFAILLGGALGMAWYGVVKT
jgi:chromate transport protein ChrA